MLNSHGTVQTIQTAWTNTEQSEYTTNVHPTVSHSAKRLLQRYEAELSGTNCQTIIDRMTQWAKSLPISDIHHGATECLLELLSPHHTFSDTISTVTIRQLLALTWLAIHDDNVRLGTLSESRRQLIEGLYESRYLATDNNPTNSHKIFSKLLEKLSAIHPDVRLKYINPAIATLTLPSIVKEETLRYLQENTTPLSADEFVKITTLLKQIKREGVSVIWDVIKDKVAARMFQEFSALYSHQDDPNFQQLINGGRGVELGEIPSFQDRLSTSPGYLDHCRAALRSYSLFSRTAQTQVSAPEPCQADKAIPGAY